MKSAIENIIYKEINTDELIMTATKIELDLFPGMCGYLSYVNAIKNKNPYFLVYLVGNEQPIGITGIYNCDCFGAEKLETAWLGWYGIKKEYRGQGLGKQILLDTINESRIRGYKKFRLYTSETRCPEALFLYDKVMDIGEFYTKEQQELKRKVYSLSLTEKTIDPWGDRDLFLRDDEEQEKNGLQIYNNLLTKK